MARYRQRTYRSRNNRARNKNVRFFIISLVVIAACVFLLMKTRNDDSETAKDPQGNTIDTAKKSFEFKPEAAIQPIKKTPVRPAPVRPAPVREPKPIATEVKPPMQPTSDSTDSKVVSLIAEALKDRNSGAIVAAREKLNEALKMDLSSQGLASVKARLSELTTNIDHRAYRNSRFGNNGWLFSNIHYDNDNLTGNYIVKPGDNLEAIGRKYKVPYEILMTINGIKDARNLRAGDKIKVINGPFHAIVNSSEFTLDLYLGNNTFVKTYGIGLGAAGQETPTGRWKVKPGGKLVKPTWTDQLTLKTYDADDPEYPLGSRWIGLEGLDGNAKGRTGFALHGTKDPDSIGVRSSRGCIRLHNGDVIEVYNLMMPGYSEVLVIE